jgi:succinate dehydrogenase / fumarate reductase flavoprotein subunit
MLPLEQRERCDADFGVNATGEAVYLDFAASFERWKEQAKFIRSKT